MGKLRFDECYTEDVALYRRIQSNLEGEVT